jgi:hypothetical protein
MKFAPDGRFFVLEQAGKILVIPARLFPCGRQSHHRRRYPSTPTRLFPSD